MRTRVILLVYVTTRSWSTVGGGQLNTAMGQHSAAVGGYNNKATTRHVLPATGRRSWPTVLFFVAPDVGSDCDGASVLGVGALFLTLWLRM